MKRLSYNQMIMRSLPIQWLFIVIVISLIIGCTSNNIEKQKAIIKHFTNQVVEIRSTSYSDQFIVRCEDGSIWEFKVDMNNDAYGNLNINYKNCLFSVPLVPVPLEK